MDDQKYSIYPEEKEFILTDGKMMIIKDINLTKVEDQGWNYTLITLKA